MERNSVNYPKLVVFGASIIQYSYGNNGLSARLADTYQRKLDVVTKGFEGYNSRWGLQLANPIFESIGKRFEAIVIFFGTNDASTPGTHLAIPEEEYVSNMSELTIIAQKYSDTVILVGNGLINELAGNSGVKVRDNVRALKYNRLLKEVATNHGAFFVDLWKEFRSYNGEAETQPGSSLLAGEKGYKGTRAVDQLVHDGIHFTPEGYRLFYEAVMRELESQGKGPDNYASIVTPVAELVKADLAHKRNSRSKL